MDVDGKKKPAREHRREKHHARCCRPQGRQEVGEQGQEGQERWPQAHQGGMRAHCPLTPTLSAYVLRQHGPNSLARSALPWQAVRAAAPGERPHQQKQQRNRVSGSGRYDRRL